MREEAPQEASGKTLILASASPRRQEILRALRWSFRVIPSGLPEETGSYSDPVRAAIALALQKAQEVATRVREGRVLGADTLVHINNHLLGKPKGREEARDFLRLLSGKDHFVTTGLALIDVTSGHEELAHETTRIRMHSLSDADIEAYLKSGEPFDKAGAYAIQGQGFILIDRIWGCYTNVVGLPVGQLKDLWARFSM